MAKAITQSLFENERPIMSLGFDYFIFGLNSKFVVVMQSDLKYINTYDTLEFAVNGIMICKPIEEITVSFFS